jgi:hypothetical protein
MYARLVPSVPFVLRNNDPWAAETAPLGLPVPDNIDVDPAFILISPSVIFRFPAGMVTLPVALPRLSVPVPGAIAIDVANAPESLIFTAPPDVDNAPDIAVPEVALPILTRPVPPVPIVVVAPPVILIEVVPVKLIGPGVTVSEENTPAPPATDTHVATLDTSENIYLVSKHIRPNSTNGCIISSRWTTLRNNR